MLQQSLRVVLIISPKNNMEKKKLTIVLPTGFVEAVNRRHNGRDIEENDRFDKVIQMQLLYAKYLKTKSKLDYCEGEWWDKMRIEEGQFSNYKRFCYAHRKRKKLMQEVKDLHRQLFYLLVHTDGNYETFDPNWCISAEEIFEDFNRKYNKINYQP